MFQEKLELRCFGPVSNAVIVFRPFTILVGDQGSGKSTISKVLTICRDVRWHLWVLEGKEEEILRPFKDFSIDEYFCEDTFFCYQNDASDEVTFKNGKFHYHLKDRVEDDEELKHILRRMIAETTNSLIERTGQEIAEGIDSQTRYLLRANTRMGLYIPAERNLVGLLSQSLASIMLNKIPFSDVVLEYMSIFEKAKKELQTYEIPFLKVKYVEKEGHGRISLLGMDKDLPLKACSSGLQTTVPMLMIIDYSRKKDCFDSFVIEEPEQNLFPRNQRELMWFFASRMISSKCNFILTTHSPYLLSCLNVQMLAHRLYAIDSVRNQVEDVISKEHVIDPDCVAVYSLGENKGDPNYCRDLRSEKTGLISINELDAVSEFIGDDFDRLYSIYLSTKRKQ